MATESALYSVDETTGIATQIGTSGFGGIGFVRGIAGLDNKLYAAGIASGEEVFHIFELDTITGHIKSGTGKLFLPDFRTTNPIRRPVGLSSNGSNLILIKASVVSPTIHKSFLCCVRPLAAVSPTPKPDERPIGSVSPVITFTLYSLSLAIIYNESGGPSFHTRVLPL